MILIYEGSSEFITYKKTGSISPASLCEGCELEEVIYPLIMMLNTRLNNINIIRKLELASIGYYVDMSAKILTGLKTGSVIGISYVELPGHKGMVFETEQISAVVYETLNRVLIL